MEFNLEETIDSMLEHGHKSDVDLSSILLKRKKIVDHGGRSYVEKRSTSLRKSLLELLPPLGPKEGTSNCTMCKLESSLPNFEFSTPGSIIR